VSEAAAATPRRLHPATLVVRWLKIAPQALAGGIGIAVSGAGKNYGGFLLFVALAAGIGALFAFLTWWRFTYAIGADEIVIEKGLLQRQRRVIPFERVQDVAIEQKLLARLFGTAKVKIETGGSGADEGSLDMIALADARALRDRVRGAERAAGEGAAAAVIPAEPLLFAMGPRRLLLAGLFNFSLVFLAAIAGLVQYLDQLNIVEWERLITVERAKEAGGLLSLRAGLTLFALVVLLGIMAGVARTVGRDFGFRLTRTQTGFRRRRGLLTLTEVVIPLRRTQGGLIRSGPVARAFGWHALSFQTLGAERKEGGMQVAAPFARLAEIAPILAEAGFPVPPPRAAFHGVPPRALVRWAAPWLALAGAAAAGAYLFEPWLGVGAGALLALSLATLLRWRKHSYAIGDQALFISRGLLTRRIWIVPFERAQIILTSRGPVQRALRLASLTVDTAGASAVRPAEIVDLDAGVAAALSSDLLARFHAARARRRLQPA